MGIGDSLKSEDVILLCFGVVALSLSILRWGFPFIFRLFGVTLKGVGEVGLLTCLFFFFFKLLFIYLFIYFWLCWVFVSVRGLPLAAASGGHSSSRCAGLSLSRPLWLRSTGSRRAGPAIAAHGPSRSAARGTLPDQGSNPCPPQRQADSQPLRHPGSPHLSLIKKFPLLPILRGHKLLSKGTGSPWFCMVPMCTTMQGEDHLPSYCSRKF